MDARFAAPTLDWGWQLAAVGEQLRLQERLRQSGARGSIWEELGGELAVVEQKGMAMVFESAGVQMRMRLFLGEFGRVMDLAERRQFDASGLVDSDLLESDMYRGEVDAMLASAFVNLPTVVSLQNMCTVFMRVRAGVAAIVHLVRLEPTMLQPLWTHVLAVHAGTVPFPSEVLADLLAQLIEVDASAAWPLRRRLLRLRILPELVLTMSGRNWCNDELSISAQMLVEHADWIKTHPVVQRLATFAQQQLQTEHLTLHDNMTLVRIFCLMIARTSFRVPQADIARLLQRAQAHPPYTLALITLLPGSADTKPMITQSLHELAASASSRALLLPWALDFHAATRSEAIEQRVRHTLGVSDVAKLTLDDNHLRWLQMVFTDTLFSKATLAKTVLDMPPVSLLQAESADVSSVTAVAGLIVNGVFRATQTDPQAWVLAQLQQCKAPVHPTLVTLVRDYARSGLARIPDRVIYAHFADNIASTDTAILLRRGLVLLFVLSWNDNAASSGSKQKTLVGGPLRAYAAETLSKMDVRATVEAVRQRTYELGPLINPLLALAVAQFPHFFGISGLLLSEATLDKLPSHAEMRLSSRTTAQWTAGTVDRPALLSPAEIAGIFSSYSESAVATRTVLDWLAFFDPIELKPYKSALLDMLFPVLVKPRIPRVVHSSFCRVWERLTLLDPASAWEAAMKAFSTDTSRNHPITYEAMVQNPLKLFTCDAFVFRCPPLFAIFLTTLQGVLVATRHWLATTKEIKSNSAAGDGQVEALASLQESTVVQLLLEICDPLGPAHSADACEGDWEETATMCCEFMHQLFIDHVDVLRLLHYQGYRRNLLPLTVNGVASMHICLDFLPDLIKEPYQQTVLFAAHLAAHLALKYPIPKSRDVVLGALQFLHGKAEAATEPSDFWSQLLPAVAQMCQAFPDLISYALTWLQDLMDAYAHLANSDGAVDLPLKALIDQTRDTIVDVLLQQPTAAVIHCAD